MATELHDAQVLIVDDSAVVRKAIRKAVTQTGVLNESIREAENGQVALDELDVELPDIIFLDINMPVMDGEQFMVAIDADGRAEQTAVVIVSTERNAKRLIRLASLGARTRLQKPFEPERLRDVIQEILDDAN